MRYEKGHKEATRRHIITTAAARFRRDGLEGVGVADLMAEAGLTVGGFYSHFKSKEDLIAQAMREAGVQGRNRFHSRVAEGGLENWIRMYLRPEHRDHPEKGCAVAAVGAELARHPKATRQGFTEYLGGIVEAMGEFLPAKLKPAARRHAALGIFATVSGALQMARTVNDPKLSEEILEAGITSALALAKSEGAIP